MSDGSGDRDVLAEINRGNTSFGSCRRPSPSILAPPIPQWVPYAAGGWAPDVGAIPNFQTLRNEPKNLRPYPRLLMKME